jgi:hypothetical protein
MTMTTYTLPNHADLVSLVRAVQGDIRDDYRAFEEVDEPGIQLTIGANESGEWNFQTGDNSYSGAAYPYPLWAVIGVYRDTDPSEAAEDLLGQLADLMSQ